MILHEIVNHHVLYEANVSSQDDCFIPHGKAKSVSILKNPICEEVPNGPRGQNGVKVAKQRDGRRNTRDVVEVFLLFLPLHYERENFDGQKKKESRKEVF